MTSTLCFSKMQAHKRLKLDFYTLSEITLCANCYNLCPEKNHREPTLIEIDGTPFTVKGTPIIRVAYTCACFAMSAASALSAVSFGPLHITRTRDSITTSDFDATGKFYPVEPLTVSCPGTQSSHEGVLHDQAHGNTLRRRLIDWDQQIDV